MSPTLPTRAAALAIAAALAAPMVAQAADAMRVVRDPKTGELRGPTAAEIAAFEKAEALLRSSRNLTTGPAQPAGPVEVTHPDGTVERKLGEDTMLSSVVQLGMDGKLRSYCLPTDEARSFVKMSSRKTAAAKGAGKVAP